MVPANVGQHELAEEVGRIADWINPVFQQCVQEVSIAAVDKGKGLDSPLYWLFW